MKMIHINNIYLVAVDSDFSSVSLYLYGGNFGVASLV